MAVGRTPPAHRRISRADNIFDLLEKELKEAQSHIERLEKLLSGDFASKAPPALVQKEREKLEGYKDTAKKLKAQLK